MGADIKFTLGLNAAQKISNTITNTAAQYALDVDQNATDTAAMRISQSSLTSLGLQIIRDGNAEYLNALSSQADANGTFYFFRNLAAANTAGPLVKFNNDNAGDDMPTVQVNQDAPAYAIKVVNTSSEGDIFLTPRASAGIGASAEGAIYFNVTTHKLMIRGAAGWETVNSA
jgi:hypothetical protein